MSDKSIGFGVERGFFCCENAVFDLPLPTIEKLTYLALVRYAGSNKRAWPSYQTIADDVSCNRKRAIQAVNKLVDIKLVEKDKRGNRSNVYLVYPPQYFVESLNVESGPRPPLDNLGVAHDHPEGGPQPPSEWPTATLRVAHDHPKNNNKNNKINSTTNEQPPVAENERENSFLNDEQAKDERLKDIETIMKAFKNKGVKVNDTLLDEFLNKHKAADVAAAINSCNFEAARNPILVIWHILNTGAFVTPVTRAAATSPVIADEVPPQSEEEMVSIKELIMRTKNNLQAKVI